MRHLRHGLALVITDRFSDMLSSRVHLAGRRLSVRFLPLAVLPHANYVAWSPGIADEDIRRLRRALREKMRGSRRLRSGLYPTLAVYRVQSSKDLRCVVRYMFKPINFQLAYEMAAQAVDCNLPAMQELSSQVDFFFESLREAMLGVVRMNRYGICAPACGGYIGHVTGERKARRKKDTERRQKRRKQEEEIRRKFPTFQPHKRHQTLQERLDQRRMRIWFQRFLDDADRLEDRRTDG